MARRCKSCKTWNDDVDYCVSCGAVISLELSEKLEWEAKTKAKSEIPPTPSETFFEDHIKNSRFLLVRWVYFILHSIWVILVTILSFFLYMIAMAPG